MRKIRIMVFVSLIVSLLGLWGIQFIYADQDSDMPAQQNSSASDAALKQDIDQADSDIQKLKQEVVDLRGQIEQGQKDQQQQSEKIRQLEDISQ